MKTPPGPNGQSPSATPSGAPLSPSARSRAAEWREFEIHKRIAESTLELRKNPQARLWNCTTLGIELEYSEHCIQNDINNMRAKGYPIDYDTRRYGFYYTKSFAPVLTPALTEGELARLFIALRAIEALKDCPAFASVLADVQKLCAALTNRLGIDYSAIASCVTFKSTGIDAHVDAGILETLITAIRNREELEVVYSKLNRETGEEVSVPPDACDYHSSSKANGSSSPNTTNQTVPHPTAPWLSVPIETRRVHPLHILCQDNVWYLFLWDPMRKAIRRFLLTRMHSITRTGNTFKRRKFDLAMEVDNSFGVTSGEPVNVRIQFRGKASYLVAERPWHHTQKLAPGPDAEWNVELTMRVAHTPELERWIMGYDQDARVIEPASLDEAIERKARGMIVIRDRRKLGRKP